MVHAMESCPTGYDMGYRMVYPMGYLVADPMRLPLGPPMSGLMD